MKYLTIALILITSSGLAFADFPTLTVDGEIILNYNTEVDIDTEITGFDNNQFNHNSAQSININVDVSKAKSIDIDTTAIGNNADYVSVDNEFASIQGNQIGGQSVAVTVVDTTVRGPVNVDVTAVGNNLSIGDITTNNPQHSYKYKGGSHPSNDVTAVELGNVQFNYESPQVVDIELSGLSLVCSDVAISTTAIGNNLSVTGSDVEVANLQINRNSGQSVNMSLVGNVGFSGDVSISGTAVGNNISVSDTL